MGARVAVFVDAGNKALTLAETITGAGYDVRVADLGGQLTAVRHWQPQLAILVCHGRSTPPRGLFSQIRTALDVPILVTGLSHDEVSVVETLRMGADDCLCDTPGDAELLARIEAHLRRRWEWCGPEKEATERICLDDASRSAILGGRVVSLTPTEYRLLARLVKESGEVVPRQELSTCLWGKDTRETGHETVSLYIHYLRKKLERDPHRPRYILTRRGTGYYLAQ